MTSSEVQWFFKQEPAMPDVLEYDGILIKQLDFDQKTKKHTHKFASMVCQNEFIDLILNTDPEKRAYYEVLVADKPQKMFADLDSGSCIDLSDEELLLKKITIAKEFELLLRDVFISLQMSFDSTLCHWLICTGKKLSLHFCYEFVFENNLKQREFWDYVTLVLKYEEKTGNYDNLFDLNLNNNTMDPIIDSCVYSRNRAMRTIYSHKGNNERVLLPYDIQSGILLPEDKKMIIHHLIYAPGEEQTKPYITYPLYDKAEELNYKILIKFIKYIIYK